MTFELDDPDFDNFLHAPFVANEFCVNQNN